LRRLFSLSALAGIRRVDVTWITSGDVYLWSTHKSRLACSSRHTNLYTVGEELPLLTFVLAKKAILRANGFADLESKSTIAAFSTRWHKRIAQSLAKYFPFPI
jgi:hypothetical protein